MASDPHSEAVLRRIDAAHSLITTEFTWPIVVGRWAEFIDELEHAKATPRVAMVSTWNSKCGIAEYSSYLTGSDSDAEFEIFANNGVEILDASRERGVTRCWLSRWDPSLDELERELELADPDVVHFQFNYGFFELKHLAAVIDRQLERRGVVITLHKTKDAEIDGDVVSLSDIRDPLARVDALIVHQDDDARILASMGIIDNVRVIPHGVASAPPLTREDVRSATAVGRGPVIGTFGFLLPHKGVLKTLALVDGLRTEFPELRLLALCARHPDAISSEYEVVVNEEIERRNLSDHVTFITDYLPDTTARALLLATDVIVLPYDNTEESASGALRFVMPCERAIVATDVPIFADVADAVMTVDHDDPRALENAVRRILNDPELQRDYEARAAADARRFRWSSVAARHRELYSAARRAHRRGA